MKQVLILFLSFLTAIPIIAQSENTMGSNSRMVIPTFDKTPDKHTGTPYLVEEMKQGTINYPDGKSQTAFLRYNAVEEIMEIKINPQDEKVYTLPKNKKTTFVIDGYNYYADEARDSEGKKLSGYFINYYEGDNIKLIGVPTPDVIPAKKATSGYEENRPAHLKVEMNYYISRDGNRPEPIKLRPRSFKKTLGNKGAMKEYFSKNKVKSLQDAIDAVSYYDSQQ